MSAHLRKPQLSIDMGTVVQTALSRGYSAQGEMFSGNNSVQVVLILFSMMLNTSGTRTKGDVCVSVVMDHPVLLREIGTVSDGTMEL